MVNTEIQNSSNWLTKEAPVKFLPKYIGGNLLSSKGPVYIISEVMRRDNKNNEIVVMFVLCH